MSPAPPAGAAPRARPVAGLPLEAALEQVGDLSRRWAIALILARPLDAFGEVPVEELSREAPALCEQLLRALASDEELTRLLSGRGGHEPTGVQPRALAALAGADGPAALVGAVEALRGAVWELLLELLAPTASGPAAAHLIADLSDRLACVCNSLLAAAVTQAEPAEGLERPFPSAPVAPTARTAPQTAEVGSHEPTGRPPEPIGEPTSGSPTREPGTVREPGIVIVDERRAAYASIERPPFRERVAAAEVPAGEIAIRDERGDEGPVAWIGSIGRQLERYEQHGESFAVLLLELRREQIVGPELGQEAMEEALEAELREVGGSLTRERAGRYWVLTPRTDRVGAEALAARLVLLTGALAKRLGAAVTVVTGTAICPEDGTEAAALAAHADVSLFASRSDLSGRARPRSGA